MADFAFALSHTATLEAPAFLPLSRYAELEAALFRQLRSLGLAAKDVKLEGPSYQPQDLVLVCSLFRYEAALRIRIESVEFSTSSKSIAGSPEVIIKVTEGALSALRELDSGLGVSRIAYDVWVHGEMRQTSEELLRRYLTATPEASVRLHPAGLTFVADLGTEGVPQSGQARVTVEPSYMVTGPRNAFLRVHCDFPGTAGQQEAHGRSMALFQEMLARFEFSG